MTNLAKAAGLASCASLALAVAACDNETTAENQVEAQADAIAKGYDADASLTEARQGHPRRGAGRKAGRRAAPKGRRDRGPPQK